MLPLLFGNISASASSPNTKSTPAKSMTTKAKAVVTGASILGAAALTIAGVHLYVDRKLEVVVIGGDVDTQGDLLNAFDEGAIDAGSERRLTDVISELIAYGRTYGYCDNDGRVKPLGYKGLQRARYKNWNVKRIPNMYNQEHDAIQDTSETGKSLRNADLIIVVATGEDQLKSIYQLLDKYTKISPTKLESGYRLNCSAMIVQFICEDGFPDIKKQIIESENRIASGQNGSPEYKNMAHVIARVNQKCMRKNLPEGEIDYTKVFHVFYWDRSSEGHTGGRCKYVSRGGSPERIDHDDCLYWYL